MSMLMTPRSRARIHGKNLVGPGGRRCVCCDEPASATPAVRRTAKRLERQKWQREVRND